MKHISLDIIKTTQEAAIAVSRLIGNNSKLEIDRIATEAIRNSLNSIDSFAGKVILCEGEKDKSWGLHKDEYLGKLGLQIKEQMQSVSSAADYVNLEKNKYQIFDTIVDPVDGTSQVFSDGSEAISVLGIANEGCIYKDIKEFYSFKLVYGQHIKSKVDISIKEPIEDICDKIAYATNKRLNNVTVCILNRPRHHEIIQRLRNIGVRVKLIQDCDIGASIIAMQYGSGIDVLYGIGGTPEMLISCLPAKIMDGYLEMYPVDSNWKQSGKSLIAEELVRGDCAISITAILDGMLLNGVKYTSNNRILTHSLFMQSVDKSIMWIKNEHVC